jgi:hypothetical protein
MKRRAQKNTVVYCCKLRIRNKKIVSMCVFYSHNLLEPLKKEHRYRRQNHLNYCQMRHLPKVDFL